MCKGQAAGKVLAANSKTGARAWPLSGCVCVPVCRYGVWNDLICQNTRFILLLCVPHAHRAGVGDALAPYACAEDARISDAARGTLLQLGELPDMPAKLALQVGLLLNHGLLCRTKTVGIDSCGACPSARAAGDLAWLYDV